MALAGAVVGPLSPILLFDFAGLLIVAAGVVALGRPALRRVSRIAGTTAAG
jgi:hypothetical protein